MTQIRRDRVGIVGTDDYSLLAIRPQISKNRSVK